MNAGGVEIGHPQVSYAYVNRLLNSAEAQTAIRKLSKSFRPEMALRLDAAPIESRHLLGVDYYRVTGRLPEVFIGGGVGNSSSRPIVLQLWVPPAQFSDGLRQRLIEANRRRAIYRSLIRLAGLKESVRLVSEDIRLIDLALKAIEQKYGVKDVSHLDLMQLQNVRTLQQSQLEIHTNDIARAESELRELTWGLFPKQLPHLDLPRPVSLSSQTVQALIRAAAEAPWAATAGGSRGSRSASEARDADGAAVPIQKKSGTSERISNAYETWTGINIRRLAGLINSAANRYTAFSDEIQLRNQEGVATAIAALEQGRGDLPTVVNQRRKLLGDHMEMLRLLLIQHEALAELVYLGGLTSLDEALEMRR